ncbi:MAG: DUF1501 domain-containing protein [Chloroflexi bacterium]|nr:DUF1501 domain-containing protein [Chloroflexota bacterium]
MALSRRELIGKGALFVASGFLAPSFLTRTALALDPAAAIANGLGGLDPSKKDKILVVIQLSGGNDGINTVVPFGDASYAGLRPQIAVKPEEALKLADGVGLHPQMTKLKGLYDQGKVAVVQGVGYPNPNRSHFRSMDIWHSARPDAFEASGWLGRYLASCECSQEGVLPAVSVGDQLNTMFWTETTLVPSVGNIGAFSFLTDTKYKNDRTFQLQTMKAIYDQAGTWSQHEALIRAGTQKALDGSDRLQQVAASYKSPVQYPGNNGLANQLKMVAQVIGGNLGSRLFSVSMGGFDTHANQAGSHGNSLKQFSEAVDAFQADLTQMKKADNVVIMTFSEFGRRAKQNGSNGTDHGSAAPMFVIGNSVKGGLYGSYPSLSSLDNNGDIKFGADFRSVYAGLLKDQLGADPTKVLAGSFPPIAMLQSSPAGGAA